MSFRMTYPPSRSIGWSAGFMLVFLSALFVSGRRQSVMELDPSWHAAIEYATAHHWQFGTQIVFTFGPLGFLSTRTSLGHLIAARIIFAFFWGGLIAFAALALARRLPGWVGYVFLAWLAVFTVSEGIDQAAFLVMACGAILLIADEPKRRWRIPLFVSAFVILSLIKITFLAAALASLVVVAACWIKQRKFASAAVLSAAAPVGFVTGWMACGQAPSHLAPWFRHALELSAGYSGAMNLVPKTPVLCAALGALALFVCAFVITAMGARRDVRRWAILTTIAQYVFFAWKEGFTRSGDWHAFVFLWFLPLGVALCFLDDLSTARAAFSRWVLNLSFAGSMVLCVVAANFQIPGFAWRQAADWPRRIIASAAMTFSILRGRPRDLFADCYNPRESRMSILDRAKDIVGNEPVDAMNYLALAPLINGMNYRPRPVFQGFVAYTPALESLNEQFLARAQRPRFVLLSHDATDGRFPALEDSAALNYVLNNYVPVARDGRFLVLKQRTADAPAFKLLHQANLNFGEKLNLQPWARQPLFMAVETTPSLLGRAAGLLYQQHPLFMQVAEDQGEERYRIVPSMARRPFLLSPLLDSNYDVMNLDAQRPGKVAESVTFERPGTASFEFHDKLTVRLYTAPDFPEAAHQVPVSRMLADVQGRIFWPEPSAAESAAPMRMTILRGSPAALVRAPSKIVLEIPQDATSFAGYFGPAEELSTDVRTLPEVVVSIAITDRSGKTRSGLQRALRPSGRSDERFSFSIPIDGDRDRSITLTTRPEPSGVSEGGWSLWSRCRIELPLPR